MVAFLMIRLCSILFLSLLSLYGVDIEMGVDNTNILNAKTHTTDYNRIGVEITIEDKNDLLGKAIIHNINNYNSHTKKNENKTDLYRAYVQYNNTQTQITLGKQRIPFGVGRIWNPIDIFNPIDFTSIETDIRKGVDALRVEHSLGDLSSLNLVYGQEKQSVKIKGYLDFADFALMALNDDKNNQNILGYEFEGELMSTGIEIRSEGGKFYGNKIDGDYFKAIFGAEYGFENSLNILTEYKYNSITDDELGLLFLYQYSPLISLSLLNITDLKDKSYLITPSLAYSLSDESELKVGVFKYGKFRNNFLTKYGEMQNSAYIRYYIYF